MIATVLDVLIWTILAVGLWFGFWLTAGCPPLRSKPEVTREEYSHLDLIVDKYVKFDEIDAEGMEHQITLVLMRDLWTPEFRKVYEQADPDCGWRQEFERGLRESVVR